MGDLNANYWMNETIKARREANDLRAQVKRLEAEVEDLNADLVTEKTNAIAMEERLQIQFGEANSHIDRIRKRYDKLVDKINAIYKILEPNNR